MQPLSGNQRPDLLTSLMNMSFVPRLPCEMHFSRPSSNVPRLPSFLEMLQNPRVLLTFDKKVHNPLGLPRATTSEGPKVLQTRQFFALTSKCTSRNNRVHFFIISTSKSGLRPSFFTLLTSKCTSRHNSVHFFIISTSKSGLRPSVVYTCYFEMCFAPQRRALVHHLNIQKCFENGAFCSF